MKKRLIPILVLALVASARVVEAGQKSPPPVAANSITNDPGAHAEGVIRGGQYVIWAREAAPDVVGAFGRWAKNPDNLPQKEQGSRMDMCALLITGRATLASIEAQFALGVQRFRAANGPSRWSAADLARLRAEAEAMIAAVEADAAKRRSAP
jgi:hypothetical protein